MTANTAAMLMIRFFPVGSTQSRQYDIAVAATITMAAKGKIMRETARPSGPRPPMAKTARMMTMVAMDHAHAGIRLIAQ